MADTLAAPLDSQAWAAFDLHIVLFLFLSNEALNPVCSISALTLFGGVLSVWEDQGVSLTLTR